MTPTLSMSSMPTCLGSTVLWAVVVASTSASDFQGECIVMGASSGTAKTRCLDATTYEAFGLKQEQVILKLEKEILYWVGLNRGVGFEGIMDEFNSDDPCLLDRAVDNLLSKGLLDFA